MNRPVYICAAQRSIIAPQGGAFADVSLHDLAAPIITDLLQKAGMPADKIDEIIVANALGAGGNPARMIALAANLPDTVAGLSIDRQCAGGLDALLLGRAIIASGQADHVIVGGAESHSMRPYRAWRKNGELIPYTQPPFAPRPEQDPDMAEAAHAVAELHAISKTRQDRFAIESHAKALAAKAALRDEITPHFAAPEQWHDSFTRKLTQNTCARAKTICQSVSYANSAVAADGAAFLLLSSKPPQNGGAKILGGVSVGDNPALPALAPIAAIKKALAITHLNLNQIDQFELMEAYAAQAIATIEALHLDMQKVNLKGGGLARGHAIGASGAVLAVRLFHDLKGSTKTGLAAIAAAGGIGTAAVIAGM